MDLAGAASCVTRFYIASQPAAARYQSAWIRFAGGAIQFSLGVLAGA
jgi:hypothetical protein